MTRLTGKAKADFIANMGHEIRNPLSVILTYAKRLNRRDSVDPLAIKEASFPTSAAQALETVVNDVLDFSQLEAGRVPIRPRPTDPTALIAQTASLLEQQAAAKSLDFSVQSRPGLPSQVMIDPDRVRQVLLNLIGNAVKCTQRGSAQVIIDYDAPSGRMMVNVEDTGPGLNAAQSELLFLRFSQITASAAHHSGGFGLGLAIFKGLGEAMNGDMSVDSRPGHGSIFRVSLPASAVSALSAAA